LAVDSEGFHFESWGRGSHRFSVPWGELEGIEFLGPGEVSTSKIGAVAVFGVLGGLAARGAESLTELLLHTVRGPLFFQVFDARPFEMRAQLTPLLARYQVREGEPI
jgi:hypothetical protein